MSSAPASRTASGRWPNPATCGRAGQSFERAYQLAELAGEPEAMALAVLGLAGLWVSERRTVTGVAMLETRLQHVLSLLGGNSSLALRIRARLAAEADYRQRDPRRDSDRAGRGQGGRGPGGPGRGAEPGPPLPARTG